MSDEVIKPIDPVACPFCHSKYAPRLYGFTEDAEDGRFQNRYAVRCLNCGAQGPKKEFGPHAVKAWNDRTSWQEPMSIEALEAAQQCIVDFLEVYNSGGSMLVMDEAVKSLRNDALAKTRLALRSLQD